MNDANTESTHAVFTILLVKHEKLSVCVCVQSFFYLVGFRLKFNTDSIHGRENAVKRISSYHIFHRDDVSRSKQSHRECTGAVLNK